MRRRAFLRNIRLSRKAGASSAIRAAAAALIVMVILTAGCGRKRLAEGVSKSGTSLTVTTAVNPSSGDVWECSIADSSVLSLVSMEYRADGEETGGFDLFHFSGRSTGGAGSTEVTFSIGKPWESEGLSGSFTLRVDTDEKGKIKDVTRVRGDYPFGEE